MPRQPKLVCQCGGDISRPIPSHCPHCGAAIVGYRRRWWLAVLPLVGIAAMFAALAAYVWWLVGKP